MGPATRRNYFVRWLSNHLGRAVRACVAALFVVSAGVVFTVVTAGSAAANDMTWSGPTAVDPGNLITSISCTSTIFCTAVDGDGNVFTYDGNSWTPNPDNPIDPGNQFTSVTCLSASFCMAVDYEGNFFSYDGTSWSAPDSLDPGNGPNDVSCPTTSFCMATDNNGGYFTYDGSAWSSRQVLSDTGISASSCASPTFCIAAGGPANGYAMIWSGSSWSPPTDIANSDNLTSVSCPTSSFCEVADLQGNATTYSNGSWDAPTSVDGELTSVSCTSSVFCAAVSANGSSSGSVFFYDGTNTWSEPDTEVDSSGLPSAISCVSPTFCVVGDSQGNIFVGSSTTETDWSSPADVDGSSLLTSVSCADPQFCVGVDESGNGISYNGSSWSSPFGLNEGQNYGVSCPSTTFCVAVGVDGTEETWNGHSWTAPNQVGSDSNILRSVSCTSSTFCIAVDGSGEYDYWNGTAWAGPISIDPGYSLLSVSCATTSFCVAVDNGGAAFTFNGDTWSGSEIDGSNAIGSVSCTSPSFCVAVDDDGDAITYNGSTWSSVDIDGSTQLITVSCQSASFCVVGDTSGNALTYDGASWSSVTIDDNVITSVSCPTAGFCAAVDDAGFAMTYGWVSADYTCDVPGYGFTTEPTLLSESPSAPASITSPGTFQTTLSVQVTIPADVINFAVGEGVTSITIGSQSVETDALTPSGSPSTSVNPNTLTASATNLPVTFTPQMNTPYTYSTTYNPETWQTVNSPGTVDFTPGPMELTSTYVISGNPTAISVSCTAPSGVPDLDTTYVAAPTATPSFQVPQSVPPLQSQVSVPFDAGWAIEIANTSTANVTGLSAAIAVQGGSGTLTYDLAGMSDTGTTCTSSGPNDATCSVGTLPGGSTRTLNVLVKTTGLAEGTTITGSASLTSTNASAQSASLTGVNVVVVPQGVAAVAVPNVALASSSKNPSKHLLAKTTLKLPSDVPAAGPQGTGPLAKVKGPPVSVTLEALAGSQDPELCPPTTGGCEGDIVEIEGNFSAYTSTATPISAVIEIYYGASVPTGHLYYQDSAGSTPTLLAACVKTGGHYNTPCVYGKQEIVGSTGKKSAEDTVFFTGGDPLVGRR